MCQLLGMNANVPTDICFSFTGFRRRGGATDHHADGWGIGFFEDQGCRVFIDTEASVNSPIAELVSAYPIRSRHVVAHIRKATQGQIRLQNTHPFQREIGGRYWLFAHNGDLKDFRGRPGRILPVGDTDSEEAFCHLLNEILADHPDGRPDEAGLLASVQRVAREVSRHGTFNFLLSNGEWLLAHCSTQLAWVVREAPFAVAHLSDDDISVDFRQHTGPDDRVAVIATAPLTDNEAWNIIAPQTLLLFRDGRLAASLPTAFEAPPVRQGAPVAHIAAEHAIPPALIA